MTDQKRLFFALWPDDETRQAIYKAFLATPQFNLEGRHTDFLNLHLTLHFLGNVSFVKHDCIMAAASKVEFESFDICLDYFNVFDKAKIFWMGARNIPRGLKQLHHDLGVQLTECDFQVEERIFAPHVTLKRKIKDFQGMDSRQSIIWRVNRFALVESITTIDGVIYQPVQFYGV